MSCTKNNSDVLEQQKLASCLAQTSVFGKGDFTDGERKKSRQDDRVVGWKAIADHLQCSVRQAQRVLESSPIVQKIRGTVWVSTSQLDQFVFVELTEGGFIR